MSRKQGIVRPMPLFTCTISRLDRNLDSRLNIAAPRNHKKRKLPQHHDRDLVVRQLSISFLVLFKPLIGLCATSSEKDDRPSAFQNLSLRSVPKTLPRRISREAFKIPIKSAYSVPGGKLSEKCARTFTMKTFAL